MAFKSHRTRFQGTLNEVSVNQLWETDMTKSTKRERLEYLNKKYDTVELFYMEYIDEYYKVNVNSDDNLSEDINIFKAIERDGSYLLNSLDLPKEKQQTYRILTEKDFKEILAKEKSLSALECTEAACDEEEVLDILDSRKKNNYVNMSHKIEKKDLTDESCGAVLSAYNKVRNHVREEMANIRNKNGSYLNLHQAKRILKTINDDMILAKIKLKGVIAASGGVGDFGAEPSYDCIDYTKWEQVKLLLKCAKMGEIRPDSVLSHLAYDMEVALRGLYSKGEIDEIDLEVVDCYNSGLTIKQTCSEVNRDSKAVRRRVDKVSKKISLFYEKK